MTLPTSPGKLAAILFFAAGIAKLFGLVAIRYGTPSDWFLAALAAAAILP